MTASRAGPSTPDARSRAAPMPASSATREQEQIAEPRRRTNAAERRKDGVEPAVDRRVASRATARPRSRRWRRAWDPPLRQAAVVTHGARTRQRHDRQQPVTTTPGKNASISRPEEALAPRVEVEAPGVADVALERGAVLARRLERAHEPLLVGDAVVRRDRAARWRPPRASRPPARSAAGPEPAAGASRRRRHDRDGDHDRREDEEVARRVRHDRHPQRQPQRVARARLDQEPVGRQQRQRQAVGVQRLHVREAASADGC